MIRKIGKVPTVCAIVADAFLLSAHGDESLGLFIAAFGSMLLCGLSLPNWSDTRGGILITRGLASIGGVATVISCIYVLSQ